MRNIIRIVAGAVPAALLVALSLQLAAAQQTPSFSGSWELNRDKSELPQPRGGGPGGGRGGGRGAGGGGLGGGAAEKMTVTQQGDELQIEMDGQGNTTYKPGAGPQESSTQRGPATVEAKWEEGVLVVQRVQQFETPRGEMTIEREQRWELSEDGNTLTQRNTTKTPRGERRSTLVYERVEQ